MLLDPSSTFETIRENIGFLRTILADGCLPVTFCRMLPYDGTPIKDELVRTGRIRGDICNPDYDFLDPRIGEFYEALTQLVSLRGWIHGLKAVTIQLTCAWHEVATMERLFPVLPGIEEYKETLRKITKRSNNLLLTVVEDLSYQFSHNRPLKWTSQEVEAARERFLDDLLRERDAFVYANQDILIETLESDGLTIIDDEEVEASHPVPHAPSAPAHLG
jgi:hypothetical protein